MVDIIQNIQAVYSKWENISNKHLSQVKAGIGPTQQQPFMSSMRDFPPSRRVQQNQFRRRMKLQKRELDAASPILGHFKLAPTVSVKNTVERPMMGLCCRCLPKSKQILTDQVSEVMGLRNILAVETQNAKCSYLTQKFCYFTYVMRKNPKHTYPVIGKTVLDDERIKEAIDSAVAQERKEKKLVQGNDTLRSLIQKHAERACRVLEDMRAAISTTLLRLTSWMLFKILSRLHNGVVIHKGQIEMLKRATTLNLPLIYVPLHRSHLDYMLLSFVLYNEEMRVPLVAAGNNLRIPVFGSILRGLGAFFIKRKIDINTGKRDMVYRAILHTYVLECLRAGHNLEIFIEGSRSRTGKPCRPKGGLLSVIVDAYYSGVIEDAQLIPVGITYDKLLEGNFISEQLGSPKTVETFTGAIRSIWRVLNSKYGGVRVNFGQPFSLKEYVEMYEKIAASGTISLPPLIPLTRTNGFNHMQGDIVSNRIGLHSALSNNSLFGTDIVLEDKRQLVENLARHIVYDSSRCLSVMATNAVAFLLLNMFRQGVSLPKLAAEIDKLRFDLSERKVDVGFSGHSVDVVNYAVSLLGPGLVKKERVASDSSEYGPDEIIRPITMLPNVIELAYYSNATVLPFALDGIVATAIHSLVGEDVNKYRGGEISVTMKRGELIRVCLELCSLLQFEFMIVQPCVPLDSVFTAVIEQFITSEVLHMEEVQYAAKKRYQEYEFVSESSDEDDYDQPWNDPNLTVNLREDVVDKLKFLQHILSPLLDTYYWCLCCLENIVGREIEERELHLDIMAYIKTRQDQGLAPFGESLNMDSVRNCLKLLEKWQVLEVYSHEGMRLCYLSNAYDSEETLAPLIEMLQRFRR